MSTVCICHMASGVQADRPTYQLGWARVGGLVGCVHETTTSLKWYFGSFRHVRMAAVPFLYLGARSNLGLLVCQATL